MAATSRMALPLLAAGQAQKEITHNEALQLPDMAVQTVVQGAPLAAPPVAPAADAVYLVAAGATGEFAGHDGAMATWSAGGWRFPSTASGISLRRGGWHVGLAVRRIGWRSTVAGIDPGTSAIGAPSGGSMVDAEARAWITEILVLLRALRLIA